MAYDPDHDVSEVVMIPLYDLKTATSFLICINSLLKAPYAAREILNCLGKA